MPYDMLSFQPAAYIGDDRRWSEDFEEITIDAVWSRIEAGAGQPIPWQGTHFGDTRCNRTAVALSTGTGLAALLDPDDPRDLAARDRLLKNYGCMYFGGTPAWILGAKILRALLAHPDDLPVIASFARRLVRRTGGLSTLVSAALRRRLSFKTFVVHNFMDAADVGPAWALMERGETSDDPKIRESQERLGACMYAMSHPETGKLIPACVQHSSLDAAENAGLRKMLPVRPVTPAGRTGTAQP